MIRNDCWEGYAILKPMRLAGHILIFLAFVIMSAVSAFSQDDPTDLVDLQRTYLEIEAKIDRNQAILDNPDKHTVMEVTNAGKEIRRDKTTLIQIWQEIKSISGDATDAPKLVVKPGETVTAMDNDSNARVTKPTEQKQTSTIMVSELRNSCKLIKDKRVDIDNRLYNYKFIHLYIDPKTNKVMTAKKAINQANYNIITLSLMRCFSRRGVVVFPHPASLPLALK